MKIGNKIRQLRKKRALTQEELADRCELTKGYISQLERDLTSPSIATLMDILECLGTTARDFFNDAIEEKIVFSKNDIFTNKNNEYKNEVHWIIPNSQKNKMEPILLELDEGGQSSMEEPHEGEEFGYVISGMVNLHLDHKSIRVKKGESFYYKPISTHYITNARKGKSVVLWVTTPPTF